MAEKQRRQDSLLIVDDDGPLLDVLARSLAADFRVLTARSVDEAWRHVEVGVDILVCDLRLADESGARLMQRATTARKIPRMIAMSGVATAADAFALAEAGALIFLEKPFTIAELRQAVDSAGHHTPRLEPLVAAQLGNRTLSEVEATVRQTMVSQAVALSGGNQQSAAKMLGLTRQRVNQILKGK